MTYTADRITQSPNVLDAVSTVQAALKTLSTDEKLGLFWVIYENLGGQLPLLLLVQLEWSSLKVC